MTAPVSIVISTRNRCADVLVAIESCLAQEYPHLEVLLYDDASTDGTADAVREKFPEVRLFASDKQQGYLVWRNRGFHDAQGDIVVSIDDDAYFTHPSTITRVVELFAESPEAGAFALPYVEPRGEFGSGRMPDRPVGTPLRSYTGCAHAVRRQLAIDLGEYPEFLIHQGEERDLCLRMLEAGYPTLYGDTPSIVHLYSPNRNLSKINYYGYRNTLLFTGLNAPLMQALPRLAIDSMQLFKHRFRLRTAFQRMGAILAGWGAIWKYRQHRRPVSRATYRTFRSLPGHGPLASDVETMPQPVTRETNLCSIS